VDRVVPEAVRRKALVADAGAWLRELPALVAHLEHAWGVRVGPALEGGTEAFVAEARLGDGTPAVLKLVVPRAGNPAQHEITVLRLARGRGCVELLRDDPERGALLLERLGPSMHDLALPLAERLAQLCAAARRLWRPVPACGLPTGADKGRWLATFVSTTWAELGRPCSRRAVDHALACAERRIAAHDPARAVLVHGDLHAWNALRSGDGFKLVDPDGLIAEAEYDMGILMREDPVELLEGDPRDRARWLAGRTGLDADAIWEWGVVERVATGLLCTRLGLQPVGRQMLAVADRVATP
jgi:streptomycin 6-kinase